MHTEFEAKFYPLPYALEEFRMLLKKHGAECTVPDRLMRRVLFGKSANTSLLADYIRVRDEGDKVSMSAKIHAVEGGNLQDQKEIELEVDSFDAAVELLKTSGMIQTEYIENRRESWVLEDAHVEIDTWPGLPTYCEVEAKSESEVQRISELLGLSWKDRRITSVVEIYAEKYGLTFEGAKKKMHVLTFQQNEFLS